MLWLVALAVGVGVALVQYGWRDLRAGPLVVVAALLRVIAIALLVGLLLDVPLGSGRARRAWAALDVSQSMTRGAGADTVVWRAAREALRRASPESVLAFGDSARPGAPTSTPSDLATLLRPVAERALGAGHPIIVITDGELDDADALEALPAGSRVQVVARPRRGDLAVVSVQAPRAIVSGDTIEFRVTLAAGNGGAAASTLTLALDRATLATRQIDAMRPFDERTVAIRTRVAGAAGSAVLRAVVAARADAEPRNDSLLTAIDLSHAPCAVFVSTAPDFDARYALAVLHGALSIPTRGFFRVAPGQWRVEGPLTPVAESVVRAAIRDAPVVILHGDTAAFGTPRALTSAPIALITPGVSAEGEWYPASAPASPLATALGGIAWDSLPPVSVPAMPPTGQWQGLVARLHRGGEAQAIVVGSDEPRRVVVVAASGLWRWRFRGGVSSDAFTALWGTIFDWLAAERADRRAAVPDQASVRAGEPVRWRRGSAADSVVLMTVRRRAASATDSVRMDSLVLRFRAGASIVETPPLAPGVYDVGVRGGTALLAVNASRELLPRAPRVRSQRVRGAAVPTDAGHTLRSSGWSFAIVVLLLCTEWILRRRRGLR